MPAGDATVEKTLLNQLLSGKTVYVEGGSLIKKLYCTIAAMGYLLHVEEVDEQEHRLYISGKEDADRNNLRGISQDIFD